WLADGVTPRIGRISASDGFNVVVLNMTGLPGVSLPAGLSTNGIPFGIQFTGPRFRDEILLGIAEAWQAVKPWPRAAPGYEPFFLWGGPRPRSAGRPAGPRPAAAAPGGRQRTGPAVRPALRSCPGPTHFRPALLLARTGKPPIAPRRRSYQSRAVPFG